MTLTEKEFSEAIREAAIVIADFCDKNIENQFIASLAGITFAARISAWNGNISKEKFMEMASMHWDDSLKKRNKIMN